MLLIRLFLLFCFLAHKLEACEPGDALLPVCAAVFTAYANEPKNSIKVGRKLGTPTHSYVALCDPASDIKEQENNDDAACRPSTQATHPLPAWILTECTGNLQDLSKTI